MTKVIYIYNMPFVVGAIPTKEYELVRHDIALFQAYLKQIIGDFPIFYN